jgi:hypothetical protein
VIARRSHFLADDLFYSEGVDVRRILMHACGLVLLCSSCAPSRSPAGTGTTEIAAIQASAPIPEATLPGSNPLVPDHVIGVRQVDDTGQLFNRETGETFVVRGVNYVYVPHDGSLSNLTLKVGVYDPSRTRLDFMALAANGYNTVRVFLDHCSAGVGCIGDSDGVGLNPAYLDNIADMLAAADEAGIFILFTSNDLPDQGGYAEQANAQSGEVFAGYRNSYYLTSGAVAATRRYWQDLLSDLIDRSAATDRVLAWQLLNEQWMFLDQPPLSLTTGLVETSTGTYDMSDPDQKQRMVSEGLIHYIAEVKAEILELDPSALVTMGFFAPGVAPNWYVDTASLLAGADLDFFDFHAYPGWQSLEELVQAFGMEGYASKPILLGEYGAFREIYPNLKPAARVVTAWQSESCDYGFDGWLYWTYYPASASVDDRTWGLVDEAGFLLELLSPNEHPDPCEQIPISSDNLAYHKPTIASASLADEPPPNAVDENASSQWGAGQDAPQWLEIDLEQPYTISKIRLLVAQWPEGPTIHRLRGRSESGTFVELTTFNQSTAGGDWLVFEPASPVEDIQVLRIDTLSSPSWVAWGEIEVFGEPIP